MKKIVIYCVLFFLSLTAVKAEMTDVERAKSKFIYNFTHFIEWPNSTKSGNFTIGVIGSDNLYSDLKDYSQGKKVIAQKIEVKKIKKASEAKDCQILFISKYKINEIQKLTKEDKKNTLIISDASQGIQKGTAINFVLMGNRLRFEFAASNLMQSGLKFSSRLKDMATKTY